MDGLKQRFREASDEVVNIVPTKEHHDPADGVLRDVVLREVDKVLGQNGSLGLPELGDLTAGVQTLEGGQQDRQQHQIQGVDNLALLAGIVQFGQDINGFLDRLFLQSGRNHFLEIGLTRRELAKQLGGDDAPVFDFGIVNAGDFVNVLPAVALGAPDDVGAGLGIDRTRHGCSCS